MAVPPSSVNYLRFVLHGKTDGVLMAQKRPSTLPLPVPEVREVRTLLRVMVGLGARKVRIAGDDPALRDDLEELVGMIAGLEGIHEVGITTRGVGLEGRCHKLRQKGLGAVNFNIDALTAKKYRAIAGSGGLKEAREAMEEALAEGLKVKLNVVLLKGINDDEIPDFVALTQKRPIQVRFVEWNSETDIVAPPERFISTRMAMAAIKPPLIPREPPATDGPALVFGLPEYEGTVGFIPNISEHFCSGCNRIGLTDTGEVLSCIFGRGLNLVRHLRSPGGVAGVTAFLDRVLRRKVHLAAKLKEFPDAVPLPEEKAAVLQD